MKLLYNKPSNHSVSIFDDNDNRIYTISPIQDLPTGTGIILTTDNDGNFIIKKNTPITEVLFSTIPVTKDGLNPITTVEELIAAFANPTISTILIGAAIQVESTQEVEVVGYKKIYGNNVITFKQGSSFHVPHNTTFVIDAHAGVIIEENVNGGLDGNLQLLYDASFIDQGSWAFQNNNSGTMKIYQGSGCSLADTLRIGSGSEDFLSIHSGFVRLTKGSFTIHGSATLLLDTEFANGKTVAVYGLLKIGSGTRLILDETCTLNLSKGAIDGLGVDSEVLFQPKSVILVSRCGIIAETVPFPGKTYAFDKTVYIFVDKNEAPEYLNTGDDLKVFGSGIFGQSVFTD
jgi:hypothetical protein